MQKIVTTLWFDGQAEEAARFYVSVFGKDNGKIGRIARYGPSGAKMSKKPVGSVMTVSFELFGQTFVGLNGGPEFHFTEAISLQVECGDQAEIDRLSAALTADGGEQGPCGWVKDKYGLSWQISPTRLAEMVADPDPVRAERVMAAMLEMKKLDLPALEAAYRG